MRLWLPKNRKKTSFKVKGKREKVKKLVQLVF